MFQSTSNNSLEATNINQIRMQIGVILLSSFAVMAFIYNTVTIYRDASLANGAPINPNFISYLVGIVCAAFAYLLYRRILVQLILHLPIGLFIMLILYPGISNFGFIVLSFVLLVYSAIMVRLPIFIVVCFVTFLLVVQHQSISGETDSILFSLIIIPLTWMIYYVIHSFENSTFTAVRTNRLLQASSDIAQIINRELELQQLLDNTVDTIRDEFDYYHVQIFLIDDKHEYANLVASTGEAGKQLLARNHRLPVGSQSVIGRVSQVGEPVVAQNTSADTVHVLNEILPHTRAELALPLIDSTNIVGALDVQSINADAFQPLDIQALQIIANQLSVAIRNARLFEQAQQNIQENKQLLFEYETNLRQVDRLNRTLTKQSWDSYLTQTYVDGVTLSGQRILPEAEWSDTMRTATTQGQTHVKANDDVQVIAVPIILRDQVLGAIEVEVSSDTHVSDSIEMIQAISQRLAVSLESARLFEETQEATLQEQQINEIVSSYETAVTIDELLQVTLERLQQALGADNGSVRLGTAQSNGTSHHLHNGNGGSPS